ncbi:hypothetical protein BVRB_9g215200 [Beta vulgaris subsp. vulgaris]|nr:hypothetical protein BVRB_9g215200 [Beta vulgaris subsp. vulgaris]
MVTFKALRIQCYKEKLVDGDDKREDVPGIQIENLSSDSCSLPCLVKEDSLNG